MWRMMPVLLGFVTLSQLREKRWLPVVIASSSAIAWGLAVGGLG